MLAFTNAHIRYPRSNTAVVQGVSLIAPGGSVTAVCGPNGSGKSTLVRALLGSAIVEQGQIAVDGSDIAALTRREVARAVAVVPQREESAFPRLVSDFIALGRFAYASPWRGATAADRQACDHAVAQTDTAAFLNRRTDELSGGEWQRVRLARALAQRSGTIVLDEPNSYLDIAHEMALFELLDTVAREGVAVLMISHQLNLVARFASRIVLLHEGRVVADGTPNEIMRGDLLERVYGWPVLVSRDPAVGAPVLVPMRRRGPA